MQWLRTLAGAHGCWRNPGGGEFAGGARVLELARKLSCTISDSPGPIPAAVRSGSAEASSSVWDAIVGVKERFAFRPERN